MAFQHINNIRIAGIAACVPKQVVENSSLAIFREQSDYAFGILSLIANLSTHYDCS